jgi:hypothetical protein
MAGVTISYQFNKINQRRSLAVNPFYFRGEILQ